MYYEEVGSGPILLLLHGAFGSIDQPHSGWTNLMPLFRENYRAIQIEHRGHGRTDNPKGQYDYEMIATDVAMFINQLDVGPVAVAGVSDGGIVALHLGMKHPETVWALIGVGVNYYNDAACMEANKFSDLAQFESNFHRASEMSKYHDRNKYPGYWRDLVRQTAANVAVNPNYSLEQLGTIAAPTLLLAGENDLWGNPEQMGQMKMAIPNCEIFTIKNAGHTIQHTHADLVSSKVLEFLSRPTFNSMQNLSAAPGDWA
jgi:pimeloyl-ACP methyl ester carboxylesterase